MILRIPFCPRLDYESKTTFVLMAERFEQEEAFDADELEESMEMLAGLIIGELSITASDLFVKKINELEMMYQQDPIGLTKHLSKLEIKMRKKFEVGTGDET